MTAGGPTGGPTGGPPGTEDEALGIVEAGEAIGIPTVTLLLQGVGMTLAQPHSVARETRRLAGDTLRILAGKSDRAPAKGDRRFADPAWAQNPAFRRLGQEYLSLCESVGHLVDDLDGSEAVGLVHQLASRYRPASTRATPAPALSVRLSPSVNTAPRYTRTKVRAVKA